jgi:hypothetical protein
MPSWLRPPPEASRRMEALLSSRRNLNPIPQPGLFQVLAPRTDLPEEVRADLLPLMQRLLQEIVQGENNAKHELNNDQDNS